MKEGVLWPKELLAKDIPNSRIYLFGYDADIVHRDPSTVTKTELESDAEDLCARLAAERAATNTVLLLETIHINTVMTDCALYRQSVRLSSSRIALVALLLRRPWSSGQDELRGTTLLSLHDNFVG